MNDDNTNQDAEKEKTENAFRALDELIEAWDQYQAHQANDPFKVSEDGTKILAADDALKRMEYARQLRYFEDRWWNLVRKNEEIINAFLFDLIGPTQATYPGVTIIDTRKELHYRDHIIMLLNYPPSTLGASQRYADEPVYMRGNRIYIQKNDNAAIGGEA